MDKGDFHTSSVWLYQSHRVDEMLLPFVQTRAEHDTILEFLVVLAEVLEAHFLGKNRIYQNQLYSITTSDLFRGRMLVG